MFLKFKYKYFKTENKNIWLQLRTQLKCVET